MALEGSRHGNFAGNLMENPASTFIIRNAASPVASRKARRSFIRFKSGFVSPVNNQQQICFDFNEADA